MRYIDTRIEKRCPKGYHKWKSDGRCHPKDEKEPTGCEPKVDTANNESSGKTVPEIVAWKPEQKDELRIKTKSAYLEPKKDGETDEEYEVREEKVREARREINKICSEHNGVVPKLRVGSFRMVYDEEKGKYVKSTKRGQGTLFDGKTTTSQAYSTEGVYVPERQKLHEKIIKELIGEFTKPPEGQRPRVIVMGGGTGAGKSSTDDYLEERGWDFKRIDPDWILMHKIPEYAELSKQNILQSAYLGHEESSDISRMMYKLLVSQGYDIIYDGTFSKESAINKIFEPLKESEYDYEVHHVGVDIDIEEGIASCHKRFVNTGRNIPDEVAKTTNQGYYDMFHREDVMDMFDSVTVMHRKGNTLTEVMTKEKGQDMVIKDRKVWDARGKGTQKVMKIDTRIRKEVEGVEGYEQNPSSPLYEAFQNLRDEIWNAFRYVRE